MISGDKIILSPFTDFCHTGDYYYSFLGVKESMSRTADGNTGCYMLFDGYFDLTGTGLVAEFNLHKKFLNMFKCIV